MNVPDRYGEAKLGKIAYQACIGSTRASLEHI